MPSAAPGTPGSERCSAAARRALQLETSSGSPLPSAWVRGLGARHKLLAAFLPACAVASLSSLFLSGLSLVGAILLALAARPPLRRVLTALARVNIFFLFLALTVPLAFGAAPQGALISLGPVHWTSPGLVTAFLATLKGNAILLLFLALPGTTPFALNCKAMLELGLPEKLVTLLQLVARHAVTFRRELAGLFTAASLRGFTPRCTLRTYRTTAYLTAMLFVRGFDKSRRMEKAMLLRGFTGKLPLLLPPEQDISALSRPMLLASCCIALALPLLEYFVPWNR